MLVQVKVPVQERMCVFRKGFVQLFWVATKANEENVKHNNPKTKCSD